MGAFFLTTKGNSAVNTHRAENAFLNMGLSGPQKMLFGEYELLLYGKIRDSSDKNCISAAEGIAFFCGTMLYGNSERSMVLEAVYSDFLAGDLDQRELMGVFFLCIYHNGRLNIFHDNMTTYQAYYATSTFCISSSFIALAESLDKLLTIDLPNVYANIISGFSIGKTTTFQEIHKFEHRFPFENKDLICHVADSVNLQHYSSFDEAVILQIEYLECYFGKVKSFLGNKLNKVDIGLSAGFDSRLILAIANKTLENLQLHSNAKKIPDKDLLISRQLATALERRLVEVPVKTSDEMSKEELAANLKKAFYFYDGQIRVNHGWTREYRTLEYRRNVLGDCVLGLSGHNGEQYRNHVYDVFRPVLLISYIKDHVFGGLAGMYSSLPELEHTVFEQIRDRWTNLYQLNNGMISFDQKRTIYSKELVRFGPGLRASIENKLSYYLMPFAEDKAWNTAKSISEYLGAHGRFEANMIHLINPKLATIDSSYGYSFDDVLKKDTFKDKLRVYIPDIVIKSYRHYKKGRGVSAENEPLLDVLHSVPGIKWDLIMKHGDEHICDRAIALGVLVRHFNPKAG